MVLFQVFKTFSPMLYNHRMLCEGKTDAMILLYSFCCYNNWLQCLANVLNKELDKDVLAAKIYIFTK